jgi:predicted transcriptional regulator
MATEVLRLTSQIVISHASMSELTPQELVEEIKEVYNVLAAMEAGAAIPEAEALEKAEEAEEVKKPPVPLKDIVKEKYVVCLECGKKMRTLKAHIRKAHKLLPKEYFKRFGLDPKKFPLVCKEYSEQRSRMAKERGLGERGGRRKATV